MDFEFDLQMFAEESTDTIDTPNEEPQENTEAIPEELAGVDESIAKEVMAELNEGNANEPEDDYDEAEEHAEADSDNKQYDDLPNQKIPYKRFKQELDRKKELEAEVKTLRQQLSQPQQSVSTDSEVPHMSVRNPLETDIREANQDTQPVINADIANQLKAAIDQEAMKMTGMTQDDIDNLEYLDDSDSQKQVWTTARKLAENNVVNQIQREYAKQVQKQQQFLAAHNENVMRFNNFASEQMQDEDFESIKSFATNEYFANLDEATQNVVASSYARVERNSASPQDTMIVMRYFTDAKNAYKSSHGKKSKNENNVMNKVKQGQSFPRSSQISNAGGDNTAVTVDTLSKMLETMPFDQIPKEYQDMLLGKG